MEHNKIEEKVATGDLRYRGGKWMVMSSRGVWGEPIENSQVARDVAVGYVQGHCNVIMNDSGGYVVPSRGFEGTRAECERESNRLRAEVGLPPLYPEKPRIEWRGDDCFIDGELFGQVQQIMGSWVAATASQAAHNASKGLVMKWLIDGAEQHIAGGQP